MSGGTMRRDGGRIGMGDDMGELRRELAWLMFEDGMGPPVRWWTPGETAERARARIAELSRLTGVRVVWVRLDLKRMECEGVEL